MAELTDYFNHRRASFRVVSRLLNCSGPMTIWQIVGVTGLSQSTAYKAIKQFRSENLIHIDRWYSDGKYCSHPIPMFVKGNYPDAPKHRKGSRNTKKLAEQKAEYYMKKHEDRVSAKTDWNGIMHGIVRGR